MNRGNIETRESFITRNLKWWVQNKDSETVTRPPLYYKFLERRRITTDDNMIIGEVGPGPFGGIIETCNLLGKKIFIDYLMNELKMLNFITWPTTAEYINSPAEEINLQDKTIDVLFSYNCLDHGWDIHKAIAECIRVSKTCYISFDCRADNEDQLLDNDIDHVLKVKFADIQSYIFDICRDYPHVEVEKVMNLRDFPVLEAMICSDPIQIRV